LVGLDEAVVGVGLETRGMVGKAAKRKTERSELVVLPPFTRFWRERRKEWRRRRRRKENRGESDA